MAEKAPAEPQVALPKLQPLAATVSRHGRSVEIVGTAPLDLLLKEEVVEEVTDQLFGSHY